MTSSTNRILAAERLRALLHYDPLTGVFTWLVSRGRTAKRGDEAGSLISDGHVKIMIDGVTYGAHNLACLYMTGAWPALEMDHEDTDPGNNRWDNLRDVPHATNCENRRRASVKSKTGFLGVSPHHRSGRFRASIRVKGRLIRLGWFDSPEDAHAAYVTAKREMHAGCTL